MRLILKNLREHFNSSNLESKILVVSMLSGMLICFASSIINFAIGMEFLTKIIPIIMGIFYIFFIYDVVIRKNFKFSAYGSLLLLTIFVFPTLWITGGGLTGSIPYFYIFMIFLTAVVLNRLPYKIIIFIQIAVVLILIYIEFKNPKLIVPYMSHSSQIIDMGYSLVIIIVLVFLLIRYIMKKYNESILELKTTQAQLEKTNEILHHSSITDPLTALHNRRYIKDKLIQIIEGNEYYSSSVIMIDIDYFKSINDGFGHDIGDLVLKKISVLFRNNTPNESHIARIGGEEFLIVIENTDLQTSIDIAENIVESYDWNIDTLSVTISAGICTFTKDDSLENIFRRADQALYNSKNTGRNKVSFYGNLT